MIRFWKKIQEKLGGSEDTIKDNLQARYRAFLDLLSENEHALELMTELENKYYNKQLISIPYLKTMIRNLSRSIKNIIFDLSKISKRDESRLLDIFEELERQVSNITSGTKEPLYTPILIPLDRITVKFVDKVGSKMANLGEVRNKCGLTTPDGFGLTACTYTHFFEYNNLYEKIPEILSQVEISNAQVLLEAEKKIKQFIKDAEVPSEIAQAIIENSEELEKRYRRPIRWAVRSSAIGEDLEYSFAGQFSSILNVPTEKLLDKYKEVVASKYNSRSILYQRIKNIRSEDVNMSVGFLVMVDALCSGVIYTVDPVHMEREEMVISSVWGLGQLLVDGTVSADTYIIKRTQGFPLAREEIVSKEIMLKLLPDGGLEREVVPEKLKAKPCLNQEQITQLAEAALLIERHFKQPQDIEWAFDKNGKLFILQSRPLHLTKKQSIEHKDIDAEIISDKGQSVAAGIGAGPVFKPKDIHDLFNFPKGGVLVLKNSSPQYIGAFPKASAVVVEKGNLTDHMSSVVREFKIPCVVRVENIYSILKDGQEITVDASRGVIYEGRVEELLERRQVDVCPVEINIRETESYKILKKISKYIFPLYLTDPRTQEFKEDGCRTWHDIIRFCHEAALNEMFQLREHSGLESIKNIYRVNTDLPFNLYLLDLFGDVVSIKDSNIVEPQDIDCIPFIYLWKGMVIPRLSWYGPDSGKTHVYGFMAAMMHTPSLEQTQYDTRSFAVLTREYLNLSLCLGYHYVTLDSYISDDPYLNHISLSFKGGAADRRRRELRIKLINMILKEVGFKTTTKRDFIKARLKGEDKDTCKDSLFKVGVLLGLTRLLDLALKDETSLERYKKEFYSMIRQ